jgi:hypothetical protein
MREKAIKARGSLALHTQLLVRRAAPTVQSCHNSTMATLGAITNECSSGLDARSDLSTQNRYLCR